MQGSRSLQDTGKVGKGSSKDDRGSGLGLKISIVTHLSLFQKHVGAQDRISPVSQTLPPSVPAELGPPSPTRTRPGRGGRVWVHVRRSVSRGSSTGDQHLLGVGDHRQRWGEEQLSLGGRILTGPWSCPHPTPGCAPEADSGSDCGPGGSPGSWHLSSGSLAYSGPAKTEISQAQMKITEGGERPIQGKQSQKGPFTNP